MLDRYLCFDCGYRAFVSLGTDGTFLKGIEEREKERLAKKLDRAVQSRVIEIVFSQESIVAPSFSQVRLTPKLKTSLLKYKSTGKQVIVVKFTIRVTVLDLDLPTSLFWAYQWFLKTGGRGRWRRGRMRRTGKSHAPVVCREILSPLRAEVPVSCRFLVNQSIEAMFSL